MLKKELPEDYKEVESLVLEAFEPSHLYNFEEPYEHHLIAKIRDLDEFIPDLSIVVQEGWEIVGHIVSVPVDLQTRNGTNKILSISLMSVKPVLQSTGVGLQLIMETIETARSMGFGAIAVVGNYDYYSKRGFEVARSLNISTNVDEYNNQISILKLDDDCFDESGGKIFYPDYMVDVK